MSGDKITLSTKLALDWDAEAITSRMVVNMPEGHGGVDHGFDQMSYSFSDFVGMSYRLQIEEMR